MTSLLATILLAASVKASDREALRAPLNAFLPRKSRQIGMSTRVVATTVSFERRVANRRLKNAAH